MFTFGFAGTVAGAAYDAANVPAELVEPVHVSVPAQLPPENTPFPAVTERGTVAPLTDAPSWSRTVTDTPIEPPATIADCAATTGWSDTLDGRWMLWIDQ